MHEVSSRREHANPSPERSAEDADLEARLGIRALVVATLALVIALYVLEANLPPNTIQVSSDDATLTKEFIPEGWAFFTASPRTSYPVVYRESGTARTWAPLHGTSLAVPSQWMGLARTQRSEGTAVAMLEAQVPPSDFVSCSTSPASCLETAVAVPVENATPHQELCGDVGIVEQQVLPWAWRGSGTVMPSRMVRVNVRC